MAPPVAATIASLRAAGTLTVDAGRIAAIEPAAHGLEVRWRPKGQAEARSILAQRVIDCTGAMGNPARSGDPLIRQLLEERMVRSGTLELGLDCDAWGSVLDAGGRPWSHLFAVGPLTRGALWEITAVPEIRAQTEQVAERALAVARRRAAA